MIKIKLQETARARGLTTAYTLQKALDCSPTMASRLWNERFKQIGIETIASLCDLFDCQPNDLFENQNSQSGNTQFGSNTQSDTTQSNNTATKKPVTAREISASAEGMVSTIEAAKRLGVDRRTVNDYIIDGKLKATKGKGNHNFISQTDLQEFIQNREWEDYGSDWTDEPE
jgi:excisionase family DNA binding protein